MTMKDAIIAAVKECGSRVLIPDSIIMSRQASKRFMNELTGDNLEGTELSRFMGISVGFSNLLPDRYALLRAMPIVNSYTSFMISEVVGIVDFGPD